MATKLNNGIDPTAHANGAQPAGIDTEKNAVGGTILAAIRAGVLTIGKLAAAKDDATKAIDTGKAATYAKLARQAYDGDWTDAAIKEQIAILRAKGNAKGKNYFGEMSKVMQENTRFQVPAFFTLAKAAWELDADTMVKAHKRQLHYVLNFLIPEAIAKVTDATRVVPANAAEAVAAAKARIADPHAQVKADFAIIERMVKSLVDMGQRYEGAGLGAVAATLAGVTPGALDVARKKAVITEHQVNEQAATVAAAHAARNKPALPPTPKPATTPLPGAIDIEALMAGMATMMDQKIAALVATAPKARARK